MMYCHYCDCAIHKMHNASSCISFFFLERA